MSGAGRIRRSPQLLETSPAPTSTPATTFCAVFIFDSQEQSEITAKQRQFIGASVGELCFATSDGTHLWHAAKNSNSWAGCQLRTSVCIKELLDAPTYGEVQDGGNDRGDGRYQPNRPALPRSFTGSPVPECATATNPLKWHGTTRTAASSQPALSPVIFCAATPQVERSTYRERRSGHRAERGARHARRRDPRWLGR